MSDSNSFSLLTKVMNIDMLLCYTDPSAINKVWQTDLMTFMEAILASYTYTYTPHKCTSPHIYTLIHTCTQYINIYTDTCLVVHLCPTLCNPMDCSSPGCSVHGIFPGKNTGVDCHFLLQGTFRTQGLDPCLLPWQVDSLPLSHLGIPQCR